jgi:F-type H+-transporting ATPase subunit gamma
MPGTRDLKRRIKSIGSTRKITRAMQLVSAAKMRKSQTATVNSRAYAGLAWDLITNLSQKMEAKSPLLNAYPDAKKTGIVLLTTNKGFVGNLNLNLMSKIKEVSANAEIISELFIYGKKAKQIAMYLNKSIAADFPKIDKTSFKIEEVYPIVKFIVECYKTGDYNKIYIVYNHFVSTLTQKATAKQLLPFVDMSGSLTINRPNNESPDEQALDSESRDDKNQQIDSSYIFEPGPNLVLNHLLPRIIESQIYQAILESDASEHSARMIMMKNATEAAGDIINDLTLTYNQLRQNKITTELAEITAGKIAIE